MSTRAGIIVKDSYGDKVKFYRHSDGYPEGTLPTLRQFLQMIKDGTIRDNTMQACGWLVEIGRQEYEKYELNWKIGAYEPTSRLGDDIEYLYEINVSTQKIKVMTPDRKLLKEETEEANK